jgi:hypothetical protein
MIVKGIVCLALIAITILTAQKLFTADYAVAAPTFIDEKCSVVIWIHAKEESKRIIYPGNYADNLCHVEIPSPQFEKTLAIACWPGLTSMEAIIT